MNTDYRHIARLAKNDEPIILSPEERARHIFIVGKSGSGKSTMLRNLAVLDILDGEGLAYVDPHGDHAEELADCIPKSRTHSVCYLNVADTDCPVGFNPMANVPSLYRATATAGIVGAFRDLFGDSWGYRSEHYLSNGIAALLEQERATLMDLPLLYTDEAFRERAIARVTDPITRRFWEGEYAGQDKKFRAEAAGPILNKIAQFTASPNVRAIIGQVRPKFDLGHAMNNRGIVILNLAKGVIGEQAANALGSLFISHVQLLTMQRGQIAPENRVPFSLMIDELQTFKTDSVATLLSEARKFEVRLALATQFTEQASPRVRAAIFGNAGTMVAYRVSGADAEILAPEFHPVEQFALTSSSPFEGWIRRSSYGSFMIYAEPPIELPGGRLPIVIEQSRRHFGRWQ